MAEVNHREESSGNIFADLNIPEPSLYLAKAELANQICRVIQERNLTQRQNLKQSHSQNRKMLLSINF